MRGPFAGCLPGWGRLLISVLVLISLMQASNGFASVPSQDCDPLGWFPDDFGLKDHAIFQYAGEYYLASNRIPGEKEFVYARSGDLCHWEQLDSVLTERVPGAWDELSVWAPFVFEEDGVYYLYYTGVTPDFTQSIMLATTTDPADPGSWEEHGMIFQPNHPDMNWQAGQWADNRDPHVIKAGTQYYLYYTGRETGGGIVGAAIADSPFGPWTDLGAVYGPVAGKMFESAAVFLYQNNFYLIYHQTAFGQSEGAYSLVSADPIAFSQPRPLPPGWAHEIWQDLQGDWRTSYLTSYAVTISPLTWNDLQKPPRPFVGADIHRLFLPTLRND